MERKKALITGIGNQDGVFLQFLLSKKLFD